VNAARLAMAAVCRALSKDRYVTSRLFQKELLHPGCAGSGFATVLRGTLGVLMQCPCSWGIRPTKSIITAHSPNAFLALVVMNATNVIRPVSRSVCGFGVSGSSSLLRRVALLCGVFVQLHLASFPAGGPFLPSLSVNI
jgi:hypothetical protein